MQNYICSFQENKERRKKKAIYKKSNGKKDNKKQLHPKHNVMKNALFAHIMGHHSRFYGAPNHKTPLITPH
jgi:hypothetical protein